MKISVQELLIVLAIVLVIFGPSQLPKLTKSLGQSLRSFKSGMEEQEPEKQEQQESGKQEPAQDEKEEV